MSDTFWKRLSTVAGLFVLASCFGLLIFVANLEIKDLDLWLHLGMGRHILNNGFQVPKVDMLSCTIAGTPWVNHEWLFQVIVYLIYQAAGPEGLITMQVILVTVTMMILLFLGYNKDRQLGSIFILLLVSLVYHGRFTIRPDLYSLLFFALYIFILSFYIDRKWSIVGLFIIQLLWTNIHGFFFFGPLFVLIGLFAEWLKRHVKLPYHWNKVGRLTNDEYRRLKWILGAVILACLANPLTFKGAWYPLGVFFQISGESKIFFEKIVELKRPITLNTLFSLDHFPFYKLLILLSGVSFIFNRKKIDIGVFFFWLVFLLFSLSAMRNMIFFAFAAYLVFVTNALTISLKDIVPVKIADKKFKYILSMIVKVFLTIWIVQYGLDLSTNGYFDFDRYERKSEFGGIAQRSYPNKAVDFLVRNKVKGNFFNTFNTGAYLVGRCSPDIKVFIDGRTEVYGPKFFKRYGNIWEKNNADEFAKALDEFDLTGVLLSSVNTHVPRNLLKYMYEQEDWVLVYFDYDGAIFLKDVPLNKDLIDRFRMDLTQWKVPKLDVLRLGSQKVTPYQHINRAYMLMSLGLEDAAIAEVNEALRITPLYQEPYKILGKIYGDRGDYQKAFENFRTALSFDSGDRKLRTSFAQAYYDLGEYDSAHEQYQRVIESWPNHPKAYFNVSRVYAKQGLFEKALNSLKYGHSLDPTHVEDILKIGDLISEEGAYEQAVEAYQLAFDAKRDLDKVYLKLGLAYQKMGDLKAAKDYFEKGLKENPENEELLEELGKMAPQGMDIEN